MTEEPGRPSDWHAAYSAWLPEALRYGAITTDDAFRAGYLAAMADAGWKDIKDAPDVCPEDGGEVGCWFCGNWAVYPMDRGMRFASRISSGNTHYRLNQSPPPKPGSIR